MNPNRFNIGFKSVQAQNRIKQTTASLELIHEDGPTPNYPWSITGDSQLAIDRGVLSLGLGKGRGGERVDCLHLSATILAGVHT